MENRTFSCLQGLTARLWVHITRISSRSIQSGVFNLAFNSYWPVTHLPGTLKSDEPGSVSQRSFFPENKQLMHRQEAAQTSIFKKFLLAWEDRGFFAVQVDEYFFKFSDAFLSESRMVIQREWTTVVLGMGKKKSL